jgi:hypothetical protein
MRALLIYPEFRSASFWNYRETCKLLDARYPAAPLGLCTVAALLPPTWEVKLLDRNVDPWDDSVLEWADVVLTGGMMPQQRDCLELIHRARELGKRVIVGGPDATSSPHLYQEASHLILGEAEVTPLPESRPAARGLQGHVARPRSPTPRFDLLGSRATTTSHPVVPGMPLQLRVLRHHRALRQGAEGQVEHADPRGAPDAL